MVNKQIQYQIYLTQNKQYMATEENITTEFTSNFINNPITKTEILLYGIKGKNENGFESIQTYTLVNKITSKFCSYIFFCCHILFVLC